MGTSRNLNSMNGAAIWSVVEDHCKGSLLFQLILAGKILGFPDGPQPNRLFKGAIPRAVYPRTRMDYLCTPPTRHHHND